MLNSRTERRAIYTIANYFTEIGWFFREQPILDFGLDAFVEIGKNGRPSGNFIAIQIKGGESNFHKSEKGLTFYFDQIHKQYWQDVGKTFPVLIIIQDPSDDNLYWRSITKETVKKTKKNWKIVIPFSSRLTNKSKEEIEDILISHNTSSSYATDYSFLTENVNKTKEKEAIIVNNNIDLGLQIILNTESKIRIINFNYSPKKLDWDYAKNELKWNHPYYFTMEVLKKYILSFNGKSENIVKEVNEIESILGTGGISKLAQFLFDWDNIDNSIPKYSCFIEAFEFFLKSKGKNKKPYGLQTVRGVIYFGIDEEEYIMDTYEGKTKELKNLIQKRSYSEIYTMTNENIWGEIYLDAGIEKAQFIPVMHNLWEEYWDNFYTSVKQELGKTSHLDKSKEKSWRQFQIFSESYNDIGDIIKYAYALDDMNMYPLAVVSMMNIFDAEVCYSEYCEYEFESGDWESIWVNDDDTKPIFYLKEM